MLLMLSSSSSLLWWLLLIGDAAFGTGTKIIHYVIMCAKTFQGLGPLGRKSCDANFVRGTY